VGSAAGPYAVAHSSECSLPAASECHLHRTGHVATQQRDLNPVDYGIMSFGGGAAGPLVQW